MTYWTIIFVFIYVFVCLVLLDLKQEILGILKLRDMMIFHKIDNFFTFIREYWFKWNQIWLF